MSLDTGAAGGDVLAGLVVDGSDEKEVVEDDDSAVGGGVDDDDKGFFKASSVSRSISTSRAVMTLERDEAVYERASGCVICHLAYSVSKSNTRGCCKYGGKTTALSLASRGNCTLNLDMSKVTSENSLFFEMMLSWMYVSNLTIASLNEPAFLTCSHVILWSCEQYGVMGVLTGLTKTDSLSKFSSVVASTTDQANSINSDESFVTYVVDSSQVVAM